MAPADIAAGRAPLQGAAMKLGLAVVVEFVAVVCVVAVTAVSGAGCGDNRASSLADASPGHDLADGRTDGAVVPPAPQITFFDYLIAVDVTPDGTLAVFEDVSTGRANGIVVDTITGEIGPPIDAGDPSSALVTGIASNKHMTAIHGDATFGAGIYRGGSWLDLASPYSSDCDPQVGGAWDISADGAVVVGMMWDGCTPVGFRWTEGASAVTSLQVVGATSGASGKPVNRASVVSDDGEVAAGFAENLMLDRSPAIWRADGSGQLLDAADQTAPGEVLSISGDGSRVAGIWANDGFSWTAAGGRVALPRLDSSLPSDPMFPNAMSADGSLVFGGIGDAFFTVPTAFVYSDASGTRDLATVARDAGLSFPTDTLLNSVLAVSADGTVLVGTATTADFSSKTFVMRLPGSALR